MATGQEKSDAMYRLKLGVAAVVAVAGGIATQIAGVGGATRLPFDLAFAMAAFVTVGTFTAFYIDLQDER